MLVNTLGKQNLMFSEGIFEPISNRYFPSIMMLVLQLPLHKRSFVFSSSSVAVPVRRVLIFVSLFSLTRGLKAFDSTTDVDAFGKCPEGGRGPPDHGPPGDISFSQRSAEFLAEPVDDEDMVLGKVGHDMADFLNRSTMNSTALVQLNEKNVWMGCVDGGTTRCSSGCPILHKFLAYLPMKFDAWKRFQFINLREYIKGNLFGISKFRVWSKALAKEWFEGQAVQWVLAMYFALLLAPLLPVVLSRFVAAVKGFGGRGGAEAKAGGGTGGEKTEDKGRRYLKNAIT